MTVPVGVNPAAVTATGTLNVEPESSVDATGLTVTDETNRTVTGVDGVGVPDAGV